MEEYFQVRELSEAVDRSEWDSLPPRARLSTLEIADLVEALGTRATFFVLGWVAERDPSLVEELADRGHEIASHGWSHRSPGQLDVEELRGEVRDSKRLLKELSGQPVRGLSLPDDPEANGRDWIFEVLAEEGYDYCLSKGGECTTSADQNGAATGSGLQRRETAAGTLVEVPVAGVDLGGIHVPTGGSLLFRHAPELFFRWAKSNLAEKSQRGALQLRCWEIDLHQPRFPLSWLTRLKHYRGREDVRPRLQQLVSSLKLGPVQEYLASVSRES